MVERVKMGSFTSAPKYNNDDQGDLPVFIDVFFHRSQTWDSLRMYCERKLNDEWPKPLDRSFVDVAPRSSDSIRIMQWNILAEALAEGSDQFVECPKEALTWETRRWRLLLEMTISQPDIICLQEVDHFGFFETIFNNIGYKGFFCPKPDSPCLYVPDNNGPDGCAMFIKKDRFDIIETETRVLEIWRCQTNHVALLCKLRLRLDEEERSFDDEFWVATTHLKARPGTFLASLRREQGVDLIDYIASLGGSRKVLLAGDLNAEPSEPIHSVLSDAGLVSVYQNQEPFYTTWTIREDGEQCKTLDYILYRQSSFHVERILQIPSARQIGRRRLPSNRYPSDHFALVADLALNES